MKRTQSQNIVVLGSDKKRKFHVVTWKHGDVLLRKLLVESAAAGGGELADRVCVKKDRPANCFSVLRDGLTIGSIVEIKTGKEKGN